MHDLTTNIGRIGGLERDFNDEVYRLLKNFLADFPKALMNLERCWNETGFSYDRTVKTGPISS